MKRFFRKNSTRKDTRKNETVQNTTTKHVKRDIGEREKLNPPSKSSSPDDDTLQDSNEADTLLNQNRKVVTHEDNSGMKIDLKALKPSLGFTLPKLNLDYDIDNSKDNLFDYYEKLGMDEDYEREKTLHENAQRSSLNGTTMKSNDGQYFYGNKDTLDYFAAKREWEKRAKRHISINTKASTNYYSKMAANAVATTTTASAITEPTVLKKEDVEPLVQKEITIFSSSLPTINEIPNETELDQTNNYTIERPAAHTIQQQQEEESLLSKYATYSFEKVEMWKDFDDMVSLQLGIALQFLGHPIKNISQEISNMPFPTSTQLYSLSTHLQQQEGNKSHSLEITDSSNSETSEPVSHNSSSHSSDATNTAFSSADDLSFISMPLIPKSPAGDVNAPLGQIVSQAEAFLKTLGLNAKFLTHETLSTEIGQPECTLSFSCSIDKEGDKSKDNKVPALAGIYYSDKDFQFISDDKFFSQTLNKCNTGLLNSKKNGSTEQGELNSETSSVCSSEMELLSTPQQTQYYQTKEIVRSANAIYRIYQYMVLNDLRYGFISTPTGTRFFKRSDTFLKSLLVSPLVNHVHNPHVTASGVFVAIAMQCILGSPKSFDITLKEFVNTENKNFGDSICSQIRENFFSHLKTKRHEECAPANNSVPRAPSANNGKVNKQVHKYEAYYSPYERVDDYYFDPKILFVNDLMEKRKSIFSPTETLANQNLVKVKQSLSPIQSTFETSNRQASWYHPIEAKVVASPNIYSLNATHPMYSGEVKWWRAMKARKNMHRIKFIRQRIAGIPNLFEGEIEVMECDIPPESEFEFQNLDNNEAMKRRNTDSSNISKGRNPNYIMSNHSNHATIITLPYKQQIQGAVKQYQKGTGKDISGNQKRQYQVINRKRSLREKGPESVAEYRNAYYTAKNNSIGMVYRRTRRMPALLKIVDVTTGLSSKEELQQMENEAQMCEYFAIHSQVAQQALCTNYVYGVVLGMLTVLGIEKPRGKVVCAKDLVFEHIEYGVCEIQVNTNLIQEMHNALDVMHSLRVLHNQIALENFIFEQVDGEEKEEPVAGFRSERENFFGPFDRYFDDSTANPDISSSTVLLEKKYKVRVINYGHSKLYSKLYSQATQEEHDELDRVCQEAIESCKLDSEKWEKLRQSFGKLSSHDNNNDFFETKNTHKNLFASNENSNDSSKALFL